MRATFIALLLAVAAALALEAVSTPVLAITVAAFAIASPFSKIARVALLAALLAVVVLAAMLVWQSSWMLAVAAALLAARPVLAAAKFARSTPATRRNYPAAIWAALRWRWLARNLALAPADKRTRHAARAEWAPTWGLVSRAVTWTRGPEGASEHVIGRTHYPPARFRPDDFGITAEVRTVPATGRAEFEKAAEHIANAWRCHRVQVSQPGPGRLIVRGLRSDPLTLPLPVGQAPPGVYGSTSELANVVGSFRSDGLGAVLSLADRRTGIRTWRPAAADRSTADQQRYGLRTYLGRDEWGTDRWLSLAGLTGITLGGLPGYGKTSLTNSLLCQLAGLPVQFVIIDGKGGGDYSDWQPRAWIHTGDELPAAAAALEDVHALMRRRFGTVLEQTGHRNAWHAGPTPDFPLIVTVIDECHTFFDLDGVKNDKQAEANARTCRTLAGQLVRKGRSVLMLTILITQKQTADAIPTAIRDNCGFGASFAVKTKDAAVASLGDHIRDYPSFCPTTLQDEGYVGVCTAALRTGTDPFVRLRVPEVTEQAAAARAAETAGNRLDPSALIPVQVTADSSTTAETTTAERVSL